MYFKSEIRIELLLGLFIFAYYSLHIKAQILNCRQSTSGFEFAGNTNSSTSGKTCETWTAQSKYSDQDFADSSKQAAENFCRNPGQKETQRSMPWCYTSRNQQTWEYCDIPLCGNENSSFVEALGMANGNIRNSQLSSTTPYTTSASVFNSRLNSGVFPWIGRTDSTGYIQVDLLLPHKITKIKIQGSTHRSWCRYGCWVKTFRVLYTADGFRWQYYTHTGGNQNTLEANDGDGNQITPVYFQPEIQARKVMIHPTTWYRYPAIRMEIYGYKVDTPVESSTIVDKDIISNTVWDIARSPFIINGVITVALNAELDIQAGVQVVMNSSLSHLIVEGCLKVSGNENLKVNINPSNVNGYISKSGVWKGIEIRGSGCGNTIIKHAVINGAVVGLQFSGRNLTMDSVRVHHCKDGIKIQNNQVATRIELHDLQIEDIQEYAIYIQDSGNILISGADIFRAKRAINYRKYISGDVEVVIKECELSHNEYPIRFDYVDSVEVSIEDVSIKTYTSYGIYMANMRKKKKVPTATLR